MWIDTHCHLNAAPFSGKVQQTVELSRKNGVSHILIPAIDRDSFTDVHDITHTVDGCSYALGIHPLYVPQSPESDLDVLEQWVREKMADSRFVAIGEIGLDFYLPPRGKSRNIFSAASWKSPVSMICRCCCTPCVRWI